MGMIIECEIKESDRTKIYREVWEGAIQKVSRTDKAVLNQAAFELANDKRFRNFGMTAAHEVLIAVSIFMVKYDV